MASNLTPDALSILKSLFAEFGESMSASEAEEARRSDIVKKVIEIGGKGPYSVGGKTLLATKRTTKKANGTEHVVYYFRGLGVDVPLTLG